MESWETRIIDYCIKKGYLTEAEFEYLKKKQKQLFQNGKSKDILTLLGEECSLSSDKIEEIRKNVTSEPKLSEKAPPIINNLPKEQEIVSIPHHTIPKRTFTRRYELARETGRTDIWILYKAHDFEKDKEVILKVIQPENPSLNEERLSQLFQEAKKISKLRHPNIVPLYEAGKKGKEYFFVTGCMEGETLSEYVGGHALSINQKVEIVEKISEALEHANKKNIFHQHNTPSNILVNSKNGTPYLIDLGLLKYFQKLEPNYKAPEQGSKGHANAKTEVYSLGTLLHELLTKYPPSTDLTASQDPCVQQLNTIIIKALEKNPKKRYNQIKDMREDMRRYLRKEKVEAEVSSYNYRKFLLVAGIAMISCILAVLIFKWLV